MSVEFVRMLLFEGRLPVGLQSDLVWHHDAEPILTSALEIQSLHLAGTPLTGSIDMLRAATAVVYRIGWRLLNQDAEAAANDPGLRMPRAPHTAAEHLGADLAFRFLPALYRRASSRAFDDPLVAAIRDLLLEWPLSGVLADIADAPKTPPDFGGHVGLGFLYAQRLAAHARPAWMPAGAGRDCFEIVWQALGKPLPALPEAALIEDIDPS
jgi:hypothetical protein